MMSIGPAIRSANQARLEFFARRKKRRDQFEQRYHTSKLVRLGKQERQILEDIHRQLNENDGLPGGIQCPECGRPMVIITANGVEIDCCRFCNGYWFDPGELSLITSTRKDIPADNLRSRKGKRRCPVCQALMAEYVYKRTSNLLVDRCPTGHGVYLEAGELERALGIMKAK